MLSTNTMLSIAGTLIVVCAIIWYIATNPGMLQHMTDTRNLTENNPPQQTASVIVAGGCFWCVESDLEKVPGVSDVVSGYSGGTTENPTYENYAAGNHREVVEVTYDPGRVSLEALLTYFIKHIDPTDPDGSFGDRGKQYSPAIYFQNESEKEVAEKVLADIEAQNIYTTPLAVPLLPREKFWPAEDYHQNYSHTHNLKYKFYRRASGRDAFIEKHWGDKANELPETSSRNQGAWQNFAKPSDTELKQNLTPEQYAITQRDKTEPAFNNEYWENKEEGIYVDVVSGEPLFSSQHKYESGTGWPSFTQPLEAENIVLKDDRSFFLLPRTEVRSKHGDSHLGHVFDDGPAPTNKRYCMNSAALRFIPKDKLEEEGYSQYKQLFS